MRGREGKRVVEVENTWWRSITHGRGSRMHGGGRKRVAEVKNAWWRSRHMAGVENAWLGVKNAWWRSNMHGGG